MNWKLIGLWVVLADFGAATAYAVWQYGYIGSFEQLFREHSDHARVVDLTIALSLIMIWMVGTPASAASACSRTWSPRSSPAASALSSISSAASATMARRPQPCRRRATRPA